MKRNQDPRFTGPEAGVTLVEMMVVLVIIAVVAGLVVPNVMDRPQQARLTAAATDLRTVASALELYRLDNRRYPTTRQGLAALVQPPSSGPQPVAWSPGGYLPASPADPWGAAFVYEAADDGQSFTLASLGADSEPGGEGANADITLAQVRQ